MPVPNNKNVDGSGIGGAVLRVAVRRRRVMETLPNEVPSIFTDWAEFPLINPTPGLAIKFHL